MKNQLKEGIIEQLTSMRYQHFDESDIGNEVGIVLGKLTPDEIDNFMSGLRHGISLSDGTHG
jgi:hypothetical protein